MYLRWLQREYPCICGVDRHIRPNCFRYIKHCRVESMMERKRLRRANLHVPRKPRVNNPRISNNMQTMTTRNENVSPRWIRKGKPAYYCANMIPVDITRSNVLGRSIGTHALPWFGLVIDPMRGAQAKKANLHTCHMQKFDKVYTSSLITWVSWLHLCLYGIFFNKCEPLLCL